MSSPAQLAALAKGRTKKCTKRKKRSSLTHSEKSLKSKDTKYDYAESSQLLGVKYMLQETLDLINKLKWDKTKLT